MNTNTIQQYKGYYWVGKNKKKSVPGIITRYSDGRIELELIGSFDSDEKNRLGDFINQNRKIRIVYGLDSDSKDITLFVIRPRAKTNLSCPFSIVTYSVVYFVYGKHVAGLDEPYKIEANVQFPELTKWCPPGLIKHGLKIGKNGVEKVVIETNDTLNYTTKFEHKLSDGTKVAFKGDCQTEISECNIYPVLYQWTDFCISHDNGITIRKIIKTIGYSLIHDWFFTRMGSGGLLGTLAEVSANSTDAAWSIKAKAFCASPPRTPSITLTHVR